MSILYISHGLFYAPNIQFLVALVPVHCFSITLSTKTVCLSVSLGHLSVGSFGLTVTRWLNFRENMHMNIKYNYSPSMYESFSHTCTYF